MPPADDGRRAAYCFSLHTVSFRSASGPFHKQFIFLLSAFQGYRVIHCLGRRTFKEQSVSQRDWAQCNELHFFSRPFSLPTPTWFMSAPNNSELPTPLQGDGSHIAPFNDP
uniref:Uncharacterized protein n=1 Tax=Trypanosoma vivax (strain Y486) TaxID=1055687 RepID=G0TS77_TRYVY|nr:hypothetical protein TVY486_0202140 [Trypanosoma vivax Y486]